MSRRRGATRSRSVTVETFSENKGAISEIVNDVETGSYRVEKFCRTRSFNLCNCELLVLMSTGGPPCFYVLCHVLS